MAEWKDLRDGHSKENKSTSEWNDSLTQNLYHCHTERKKHLGQRSEADPKTEMILQKLQHHFCSHTLWALLPYLETGLSQRSWHI